jgi:septal ring-binding cell division protein DamX
MSYDFSFNNKTISFLLGGLVFVGTMLFVAGLLVGASWRAETPATVATLREQQPPVRATQPQPASPEPVLKAGAPAKEAAAPVEAAAPDGVAAPDKVEAPGTTPPTPGKQAHSASIALRSSEERAPAPVPEADGDDVRVVQRADASATDTEDLNKANTLSYAVQVGVFLDENNANQFVRDLQDKGYTPTILKANDDRYRVWYAVRIGAYMNKTAAMQAAAGIARQEKIKVIVRPLGSL